MPSPRTRIAKGAIDFIVEHGAPVAKAVSDFAVEHGAPIVRGIEDALGIAERRPPRQKPQVRLRRPDPHDADPVKWLERARTEAAERYGVHNRLPGKLTASVKGRVDLDPQKLKNIPGAMGERRVPGDEKYDRLMASVQEKGFDPNTHIWLGVNHLGEPYVAEGNTRLAVARDLGIDRIPAEVMWYGGGEEVPNAMLRPDNIEAFMAQSELMRDPNFLKWFEGSKLVDEYGEPQRLYHGTDRDFQSFDDAANRRADAGMGADFTDTGWFGKGHYLTPSANAGSGYAGKQTGANVMPVYAALKNPFIVRGLGGRDMDRYLSAAGADFTPAQLSRGYRLPSEQTAWLRAQGYDGVHAFDPSDPGAPPEIVVFEPTQIKSAIGNRGTYDPNDPDITKAKGGLAVKPVWDKKRPKDLGEPKSLSVKKKAAAKRRAEAAGRPYPNLVDNMAVARKRGK